MNAVSNLRRIFIPNRGSLIPGKIQSVLDRPKHWMSSTKTPLQSNIPPKNEKNNINQILYVAPLGPILGIIFHIITFCFLECRIHHFIGTHEADWISFHTIISQFPYELYDVFPEEII